jgi:hypothetical protein
MLDAQSEIPLLGPLFRAAKFALFRGRTVIASGKKRGTLPHSAVGALVNVQLSAKEGVHVFHAGTIANSD